MKIGFMGLGNMAKAGLTNLLNSGADQKNIQIISPSMKELDRYPLQAEATRYELNIAVSNTALIDACDVIILGFKPYQIDKALFELPTNVHHKYFISIMAGVSIDTLSHKLGVKTDQILRLMPNTPCLINQGIGAHYLSLNKTTTPCMAKTLNNISLAFNCPIRLMKEAQINAVTAISGSGVAYVYLLCECLLAYSESKNIDQTLKNYFYPLRQNTKTNTLIHIVKKQMVQWGVENAIESENSRLLVEQTFLGAYALMKKAHDEHLKEKESSREMRQLIQTLRNQVTSKKGTTHAALTVLLTHNALENAVSDSLTNESHHALKTLIKKAMNAAYKQAQAMS